MKLHFFSPPELEESVRPIFSMLKSYCRNFRIQLVETPEEADAILFYGRYFEVNKPMIFVPHVSGHFTPNRVKLSYKNSLPAPENTNFFIEENRMVFTGDLLAFLAGQLFRAEEKREEHRDASLHAQPGEMLGQKYQFFDRPIVDLWFQRLFQFLFPGELKSIWAQKTPGSIWMTHDVDILLKWTWKQSLWLMGNLPWKIFKGRETFRDLGSMMRSVFQGKDVFDCVQKIQRLEVGLPSTFFFMGWPRDHLGRRYNLTRRRFANIALEARERGAEVGIHTSPIHLEQPEILQEEAKRFESVFQEPAKYVRQHYLYWDLFKTPRLQENLGIQLDTTLGFNHSPSFRCGTCMPFKWYDLWENKELELVEVPLISADHQLGKVLQEGPEKALPIFDNIQRLVESAGGIHTQLFHNMYFSEIDYPGFSTMYTEWLGRLQSRQVPFLTGEDILKRFTEKDHELFTKK